MFLSSPLGHARDVGGLSIVAPRARLMFRLTLGGYPSSLPLSLSISCLTRFQKALYLLSPGGDALHYALTCLIMHSFMQPLPYVNALYD